MSTSKCRTCRNNHTFLYPDCDPRCNRMCDGYSDYEPITEIDYIRAMDEDMMATHILNMIQEECGEGLPTKECLVERLKRPVEVN